MKTQSFSPITVNMELKGSTNGVLNNYGKAVVQLRQTVSTRTEYEAREGNSRSGALAGISAKVGGATYNNESIRTTLFAIEAGVTAEQVQAAIDSLVADGKKPCLYQVISCDVVTTSEQAYRIGQGVLSKETLAETQMVKPDGTTPVITDGAFTFRQCYFWPDEHADEDERDIAEVFVPAAYAHLLTPSMPLVQGTAAEADAEAARELGAGVLVDNEDSL